LKVSRWQLCSQVARDGSGGQQERPSTAPPSGKRTPPPVATPASPHALEHTGGLYPPAFPDPVAPQQSPSSFLGLGGFAGFMGGGQALQPQASSAEALSPFPGMSLHRRVAPPARSNAVQARTLLFLLH